MSLISCPLYLILCVFNLLLVCCTNEQESIDHSIHVLQNPIEKLCDIRFMFGTQTRSMHLCPQPLLFLLPAGGLTTSVPISPRPHVCGSAVGPKMQLRMEPRKSYSCSSSKLPKNIFGELFYWATEKRANVIGDKVKEEVGRS